MSKLTSKSSIERATAGEGPLGRALRSRDLGALSSGNQSAIADILSGGRSAIAPAAHEKSVRGAAFSPLPERAEHVPTTTLNDQGKIGVSVTSVSDIGELVRQARVRLGLNQQRFADLAGVGRRFVSELESGKASIEAGRVLRCCLAAGIDIFARTRQP